MVIMGHIVPSLSIASLIGIWPLCKAGCKVLLDDKNFKVFYNGNIISTGYKDPSTDLWMLPIPTKKVWNTPSLDTVSLHSAHMMLSHHVEHTRAPIYHAMAPEQPSRWVMRGNFMMALPLPQPGPCIGCAPHLQPLELAVHAGINIVTFAHLVHTWANTIKFAHQSLGNPKISTLLKATHKGFLKGCLNISESSILQYLNPSPAIAKGHMKRPCHGIRSTWPKSPQAQANPYHTQCTLAACHPNKSTCVATLPGGPGVSRTRVWCYHRLQADWGWWQ